MGWGPRPSSSPPRHDPQQPHAVSHDGAQSYHERYRQIFKIIQERDRQIARIFDDPRRSQALIMLAQMRREGLLTEEEFSSLSTQSRGAIEMMLGTR